MTIHQTVQCIACQNFSYQDAPRGMSSDGGFGRCKFDKSYQFASATYPRYCPKFVAAEQGVVDKRIAWRNQQKAKFIKEILA